MYLWYKITSNEFVVDSSISTNPFSIELLLQEAKITNKRIPQYTEFLKTLGVEENKLHLLTRNELKEFAEEYKKDHSEFVLVPLDARIAEATTNWGKKGKAFAISICLMHIICENHSQVFHSSSFLLFHGIIFD